MSDHVSFTARTGIKMFLADLRCPWQRPTNDDSGGLPRQYFPREPTCRAGARQTPRTSPTHSITVPGRSSATRLRPRCSTSSCNQCGQHSIDPPGTAYRLSNLVIGSALTAPITLDEIACGHRLRAGSRLCAASCDAPHQPTSDPCR